MRRMEAITQSNLDRHGVISADMRAGNPRLGGKLDARVARLDTLQSRFSWKLAWFGIVMALALARFQRLWR